MPIQPWGAMVLGSLAGIVSVLGYKFLTVNELVLLQSCSCHIFGGGGLPKTQIKKDIADVFSFMYNFYAVLLFECIYTESYM